MANSSEPQPAWIRPTMWVAAGIIVVALVGFFVLVAVHAPLWLGLVSLAVSAGGFVLLGVSGRANIRTGGRRAGARPDGKPSAVDKWMRYVVSAGFVLTGATLLVTGVIGSSGRGVLTGLFLMALGVVAYFVIRKVSTDLKS